MERNSKYPIKSLIGKTAIVTGGARGIGKIIAAKLINAGAKVLICSRTESEIQNTLKEVNNPKKLFGLKIDISSETDCKKLIKYALNIFQKIDILVNNAGIYGPIGLLENIKTTDWVDTINTNLIGTVMCTKLILPYMKKQGSGKIINLAGGGVGSKKSLPRFSAYYTSKAAIVAFTELMANEVKDNNIQINCISPGAINTHFTQYLLSKNIEEVGEKRYYETLKQQQSGGDSPKVAAKMVVFLASKQADHISGKLISTKWDNPRFLTKILDNDIYTLRRIDNHLFVKKNND